MLRVVTKISPQQIKVAVFSTRTTRQLERIISSTFFPFLCARSRGQLPLPSVQNFPQKDH